MFRRMAGKAQFSVVRDVLDYVLIEFGILMTPIRLIKTCSDEI
jgi:hypothetical protein